MALLRLVLITPFVLVLRLIGLAYHLALAVVPHSLHTRLWITDVPDAIRKGRVGLKTRANAKEVVGGNMQVKMSA